MPRRAPAHKLPKDAPRSTGYALTHGLTAQTAANENREHFDENLLVHQMIMAAWRLARTCGIETGLFNLGLSDLHDELGRRAKQGQTEVSPYFAVSAMQGPGMPGLECAKSSERPTSVHGSFTADTT
jgi:hypothetical protein